MLSVIKLAFISLDPRTIALLYKTFVLPILEYCSSIWCPFYVKDIEVLEKVQRRFTRILPTYRDLPYKDRLIEYNLNSLYARRLLFDLVFLFKIVWGLVDIDKHKYFDFDVDSRTRGHNFKVRGLYSRLDIRKHWFTLRVIPFWNSLPQKAVNATSVLAFKREVWIHFSTIGIF